jgi:uncharacterized protein with GYD domain
MPIYVTLGNWTDQGTKDFGGAVERANGFRAFLGRAATVERQENVSGRASRMSVQHAVIGHHST